MSGAKSRNLVHQKKTNLQTVMRGSSSVSFAYLFLLLFGQIGNIYKVEQDSLYFFFLEGGFKGIYLRERNFPFLLWFQRYEGSAPTFHGEALEIFFNQTFFCSGLEYLFIR